MTKYFAMNKEARNNQFVNGTANPLYTEVFPNEDFASSGYWFWLKSASAHRFDVDSFDQNYVYLRSTGLDWTDNTTFKRKHKDVPIAARCVPLNAPGPWNPGLEYADRLVLAVHSVQVEFFRNHSE